jgi:phosphate transport system protein
MRWDDGREARFIQSDVAGIRKPKFYVQGTSGTAAADYAPVTIDQLVDGRGHVAHEWHHAEVATDLRLVMSAIRMSGSLERMGDLAVHIAKQVRLRYPNPSIPAELKDTFAKMGQAASKIVEQTGQVIASRDTSLADKMKNYDDTLDDLHRELFTVVLSDDWKHGVEAAIDVTLLSRFYERFGDHAVSVARRVIHIVTGEPYAK